VEIPICFSPILSPDFEKIILRLKRKFGNKTVKEKMIKSKNTEKLPKTSVFAEICKKRCLDIMRLLKIG